MLNQEFDYSGVRCEYIRGPRFYLCEYLGMEVFNRVLHTAMFSNSRTRVNLSRS